MPRIAFFIVSAVLTAMVLTMLVNIAKADQRTIYGSDGKVIGRSVTDSQGTTTLYGADGRALTREAPNTGGSTIYDARTGKTLGKVDDKRR